MLEPDCFISQKCSHAFGNHTNSFHKFIQHTNPSWPPPPMSTNEQYRSTKKKNQEDAKQLAKHTIQATARRSLESVFRMIFKTIRFYKTTSLIVLLLLLFSCAWTNWTCSLKFLPRIGNLVHQHEFQSASPPFIPWLYVLNHPHYQVRKGNTVQRRKR